MYFVGWSVGNTGEKSMSFSCVLYRDSEGSLLITLLMVLEMCPGASAIFLFKRKKKNHHEKKGMKEECLLSLME